MKVPVRNIVVAAMLLAVSFLFGCGKGKETPAADGKSTAFFVADFNGAAVPVSEISILSTQRAYLEIHGSLTAGKTYKAVYSAKDGEGHEVPLPATTQEFVAEGPNQIVWCSYLPDYRKSKHGKWKWTAEVTDVGRFQTEVNVLPPTPDQEKELAQHERANQSAARAFAYYWRTKGESLFTKIIRTDERVEVSEVPRPPPPKKKPVSDPYLDIDINRPPPVQGPQYATNAFYTTNVSLIEVKDFSFGAAAYGVSEADRLNGISYRGGMSVGFRVYRTFEPQIGWTDWQDTSRVLNSNPFIESLSRLFGPMAPGELENTLNLSFVVMERDGNWFVDTSRGDRFANGKLVSKGNQTYSTPVSPPAGWEQPSKFVASQSVTIVTAAPSPKDIEEGLAGRTPSRDTDAAIGSAARENPAEMERAIINTMETLLTRPLAR